VRPGDHVVACFPLDGDYFFQARGVIIETTDADALVRWDNGMQTTPRLTPIADLTVIDPAEYDRWCESNRQMDCAKLIRNGIVTIRDEPTQDEIDNEVALWSPNT
jgi:hypothetical protein